MNAHMMPDDQSTIGDTLETEQALLGAILVNNDAYWVVSSFLKAEHFSEPLHQELFGLIAEQVEKGMTCNPVTVAAMRGLDFEITKGLSWKGYLARMAAEAVTIINAQHFGKVIFDGHRCRVLASECKQVIDDMRREYALTSINDILDRATDRLADIRQAQANINTVTESYLDTIDPAKAVERGEGVPIWSDEIQEVLSEPEFEPGNLYGLLSSSGEGKTSLLLRIIWHALDHGHPVLFLSYDQSRNQCIRQLVSILHGIGGKQQRLRHLSPQELQTCRDFDRQIAAMPFEVVHCTDEKVSKLSTYARRFVRAHRKKGAKTPLIAVDHIGAITKDDTRADAGTQAASVNRPMKALAIELNAPILMLNQRNGKGDNRPNPRPIAADLYGAGKAREDYDAVFYLYRFMKWYRERKGNAATPSEERLIERVFPTRVREDNQDIAEIGAIKVRYGDPSLKGFLKFEAEFTRYDSAIRVPQEGFGF